MKLKTTLCLALAVVLLLGCLTGCQGVEPARPAGFGDPKPALNRPEPAVLLAAVVNAKALGFSDFDNQLVEYLKQTGKAEENFTVSPLSFKAALTLAALGAEGETRDQLLRALGYADLDGLRAWYAGVLAGQDSFAPRAESASARQAAAASSRKLWRNSPGISVLDQTELTTR